MKIREICNITMGQSPSSATYNENGDGLPFFQGAADFGKKFPMTRVWCSSPLKIAYAGDILISVRAPVGTMNIATSECCIGRGLAAIKVDEDACDSNYFWFALESKISELNNKGSGSTFKAISKSILEETEIPLPELEEQRKIAKILTGIENISFARQQQRAKLDELVKARFVEMFGDSETNPKSWPTIPIGKTITSCESGWSGNGTQRLKKHGEIAVLKVSAVTKGIFIPEECKVLDDQENIKKYIFPQKGDLLFSRANTREMVGATAVVSEDYPEHILPDKLWRIRFNNDVTVWYMKHVLSSPSVRSKFSAVSTGTSGSMYNVSMDKFKSIVIPIPPLHRQQQFADFVEQVNSLVQVIQKSLEQMKTLKKALMQQYFG